MLETGKGPRSRRERREKREERKEKRIAPTSEPSLNPLRMCWNRAKKIHLISEKLILAVAKERFEPQVRQAATASKEKSYEKALAREAEGARRRASI